MHKIFISCVSEDKCGEYLGIRGDDLDEFFCEDASLICCHEEQITEPRAEQCSKFASEGYR